MTGRPSLGSALHLWPNQNLSKVTPGESSLTALAFRNRTWRTWPLGLEAEAVTGFEKAKTNGYHRRQNTPFWWSRASCLLSPPSPGPQPYKNTWSGEAPVVLTSAVSSLTCRHSEVLARGVGVLLMYFKCDLSTTFVFTRTA